MLPPEQEKPLQVACDEQEVSLDLPIEIIPDDLCAMGVTVLKERFKQEFSNPKEVSIVPIMRGGNVIGQELCSVYGQEPNRMRMSYYSSNGVRLPYPVCLYKPKVEDFFNNEIAKKIVFSEAVVESQGTIQTAIVVIKKQIDDYAKLNQTQISYPDFYLYTLVTKTNGDDIINGLTRISASFEVNRNIWIYGMGCDNNERGRAEKRIMGILSPFAKEKPHKPYFKRLF